MPPITQDRPREIVEDFAKAIQRRKTATAKPRMTVINFRDEKRNSIQRPIEVVPVELLRYRKDNGRISSDVLNYEKLNGPLDEKDRDAQGVLRDFLLKKDPEKTHALIRSIEHAGQSEPAIITCDGFLINGNRRKMALEKLRETTRKSDYETMKVVILPGFGDPGGPPNLLEIERLENRYQLQSDGKSEYYGFDRAISIKRKIAVGLSLKEQLLDDPLYAHLKDQELERAVQKSQRDYLQPLECVDRYLAHLGREQLYEIISSGASDKEGRWQAFIDYSKFYYNQLTNKAWQVKNGLEEEDVGSIEDAAFKLIRLRSLKDLPKVHQLMRKLPKLCALSESKREILHISDDVNSSLTRHEQFDKDGNPLSSTDVDGKWAELNRKSLIHRVKRALESLDDSKERETPLTLLQAALKSLNSPSLSVDAIDSTDFGRAKTVISSIQQRAGEIEHELYNQKKKRKPKAAKKTARAAGSR